MKTAVTLSLWLAVTLMAVWGAGFVDTALNLPGPMWLWALLCAGWLLGLPRLSRLPEWARAFWVAAPLVLIFVGAVLAVG